VGGLLLLYYAGHMVPALAHGVCLAGVVNLVAAKHVPPQLEELMMGALRGAQCWWSHWSAGVPSQDGMAVRGVWILPGVCAGPVAGRTPGMSLSTGLMTSLPQ
jgi:hypothetical protein